MTMSSRPNYIGPKFRKITEMRSSLDGIIGPLTLYWSICERSTVTGKYTVVAQSKEIVRYPPWHQCSKLRLVTLI